MSEKPLLVLLTGTTVPTVLPVQGDFDRQFRDAIGDAYQGPWRVIDVRPEGAVAALPAPESIAGVIISGSSSSVTERAPWMLGLEAWLRDAVSKDAAVLGVCFGHQILAQAMGGQVRKNPAGRRLGTHEITRVIDDPLFDGAPDRFAVNVSHQDHVAIAPLDARMLATASHDALHAFAIGKSARGVQFHPEFSGAIVRGYIEARREVVTREGMDADALYRSATDAPHAKRVLRNFVMHFVRK